MAIATAVLAVDVFKLLCMRTSNAQQVVSHAVKGLRLRGLLQLVYCPCLAHIGPKHQLLTILRIKPHDLNSSTS